MVKGISRQVILVQNPDRKLFEQAIFILKEDAVGVTEEMLLKEARQAASGRTSSQVQKWRYSLFGTALGAFLTGLCWFLATVVG